MKKSKSTPTRPIHRPLNIIAWIIAAISLISGVTLSILATQPSNNPLANPENLQIPENSKPTSSPAENQQPPSNQPYENNFNHKDDFHRTSSISLIYAILIIICALLLSLSIIYLIMSNLHQDFYTNPDKLIILALSTILLTIILSAVDIITINSHLESTNVFRPDDSSTPRNDTELDKTNVADSDNINLNEQSSDINITKSGTYTFTGEFSHSIIVDAKNTEVKLILDNVTINNPETAAIIGLNANKITISTTKDSQNTLSDGGNSTYDGCIYSNAELVFEGEGTLIVNGKQNEGEGIATETQPITFNSGTYIVTSNDDGINAGGDGALITFNDGNFYINADGDGIDSNKNAIINGGTIFVIGSDIGGDAGIDTDDGFTINGGTVIALGSDMVETPLNSSKQNSLALSLANSITKDTPVALQHDNQAILTFSAPKSFRTIIISSPELKADTSYGISIGGTHTGKLLNGIYENGNYTGGELLTIDNSSSFKITSTVSSFGNSNRR